MASKVVYTFSRHKCVRKEMKWEIQRDRGTGKWEMHRGCDIVEMNSVHMEVENGYD